MRVPHELIRPLLSTRKVLLERVGRNPQFSHFGEEAVITRLLQTYPQAQRVAVDLGASDGVEGSNTYKLYKDGWGGLAVEPDPRAFAFLALALTGAAGDVGLARAGVSPDNVVPLLDAHGIPKDFGFLDLDIDGYEYFVLDALLAEYRPGLICLEINEKLPPPINFRVKYDPAWRWRDDELFGLSIVATDEVARRHGYAIVEQHYNNAFLVPAEVAGDAALTPEQAYTEGYVNKADRLERFPWNAQYEALQTMTPEEVRDHLARRHPDRVDAYEISW
ncbi:FkbM family methyltransferase [Solirubrobacter phytolaccae]|uniref:FkbM family methyltransferase n=1 Tax=Solirubrobacter phytolaccae TaxID=1404360 RepID=A0A9X3SEP8_9ACTN|nr:hypothetical protein [Solirubrobacter phytolaccae]MDA0185150.1 FkbM family methyltransferase [Solirubrobacter phytolaccae]